MTSITPNHTKHLLARGGVALGLGVRLARTVEIATIGKSCGYDWLFIDMEHSSMNADTAAQMSMAALAVGITPIVRVPGKEHHHASRLLDAGAQGIVVPHVDTAEEAAQAVSYCRYPPTGHRSMMGVLPQTSFLGGGDADTPQIVNDETLVALMIETPTALDNIESIAAVPGIDVLLIGTNDLSAEMGLTGQFGHPRIEAAYRAVLSACAKRGIHAGMGGVYEPALMEKYIGMGMRFILSGNDLSFMMSAARDRTRFIRGIEGQ
jgi:2-keto-3-deoxy-L-rhamnonate aldolase RhmA